LLIRITFKDLNVLISRWDIPSKKDLYHNKRIISKDAYVALKNKFDRLMKKKKQLEEL